MSTLSGDKREFDDLEQYCSWLEDHATDFKYEHQIADIFQQIRDKSGEAGDSGATEQAQWEVDAFNFVLKDGRLKWQFQGTDGEGNPFEYPSLERLDERAADYFEQRLSVSKNPVLRARYSHLLWEGLRKKQQFAHQAVTEYLKLIPIFEKKCGDQPEQHFGQDIVAFLEAALSLSAQIHENIEPVKAELLRILHSFPRESVSWFRVRFSLAKLLLDNRKLFAEAELEFLPQFCLDTAEILFDSSIHKAITMYELGESADIKLVKQTTQWSLKIAKAYEVLMNRRVNEPMSAGHFCEQALLYYRKAKVRQKVSDLERKREDFSKKIQLQTVKSEVDLTDHLKWCKEVADRFAAQDTLKVMAGIAGDQELLPDVEDVVKLAQESLREHPVLRLAPETILDKRGHIVQYAASPEEKERAETYKIFHFFIRMDKIHLIHEVLVASNRAGKLTCDSVRKCLEDNSWICQTLTFEVAGHEIQYRWIDVLGPGLKAYFEVLEAAANQEALPDSAILAIDSLTLKFEGMIRDLCRLSGAVTTFDKPDRQSGNMVTHEKDISGLLREEALQRILTQQDLFFLKYLLCEQLGLNLRHSVAHCLLNREDYDLGKAHLVFIGILRLSRFQLDSPPGRQ